MDKKKNKRVTMQEVASKAGVTIGTVSNVINDTARVSDKTRKRVLKVIDELSYIPNPMAQYMRSKKSRIIGLLIPNINNYFHSNIASTFIDEAGREGYSVIIIGYNYSLECEKRAIDSLLGYNVDVIVIANGYNDETYIKQILERKVFVILVDRSTMMDSVHYIQYDNKDVMYETVAMLKDKGYKSIGYISEPLRLTNLKDRYQSYLLALHKYQYNVDDKHIFISEKLCMDNIRNGYLYMREILQKYSKEELPEAFIVSSDLAAIGIMRAINELGYNIPGDFGVVGCDNIDVARYMNPRLTTVNQDQVLMGKELWKMVKRCCEGKKVKNVTLKQELIIRESC